MDSGSETINNKNPVNAIMSSLCVFNLHNSKMATPQNSVFMVLPISQLIYGIYR